MEYELIKIIVLGDAGVGKSSMLLRFEKDIYNDNFFSTIGVDFLIKKTQIEGKKYKIHLWDLAGSEMYRNIVNTYYRTGQGIILSFDITNYKSFENLKLWLINIYKYRKENAVLFIVGLKNDLEELRKVPYTIAKKFADSLDIEYHEVSSKDNNNIENMFTKLIKNIQVEIDRDNEINTEIKLLKINEVNKKCCV